MPGFREYLEQLHLGEKATEPPPPEAKVTKEQAIAKAESILEMARKKKAAGGT